MRAQAIKRSVSFAVPLLVATTFACTISARVHKLNNAYQSAATGASMTDMILHLGTPWRDTACGVVFGGTEPDGCDREVLYAHPFPSIIPTYWAYRYDHNGKLLDKYEYVLP